MQLDVIYKGDSRNMSEIEDGSVQLIVTSPPYNVGKLYDGYRDKRAFREYEAFLLQVWKECVRALCEGGRIAINVANTNRTPYIPLNAIISSQMTSLGLLMRGEIIWDKGASVGVSTAWGSFARPSNPVLRDVHEYILVFSKEKYALYTNGRSSGIKNNDFAKWTQSVWQFPTESSKRLGHPAPYPIELPKRLILLYTAEGDTVLDPFLGSGTTAIAARSLGRHFVGYEISTRYCRLAARRLNDV